MKLGSQKEKDNNKCGKITSMNVSFLDVEIKYRSGFMKQAKGGFLSESAMNFFQISKSQKKNIPKNYPELEI